MKSSIISLSTIPTLMVFFYRYGCRMNNVWEFLVLIWPPLIHRSANNQAAASYSHSVLILMMMFCLNKSRFRLRF